MGSGNYPEKFDKVFNTKKILNIVISSIIVAGGLFAMALIFSGLLYKINRKLYWKWYEGIFKSK